MSKVEIVPAHGFDTMPMEEIQSYISEFNQHVLPNTLKLHFWSRLHDVEKMTVTPVGTKTYHYRAKVRRGLVIGFMNECGQAMVGWSLCSLLDEFNNNRALAAAFARSVSIDTYLDGSCFDVPRSLRPLVKRMLVRTYATMVNKFFHLS